MIDVRRATLADRERLFAFIDEAYGDRAPAKIPERWRWAYETPPYGPPPGEHDPLSILVAVVERTGRIVGQSCFVEHRLRLGGATHRMMWGADGFVLPSHRGHGLGFVMQQRLHALGPAFLTLNVSEANRRIKARLGSVPLPAVRVYARRERHARAAVGGQVAAALRRLRVPAGAADVATRRLGLDRVATRALDLRLARRRRREPVSAMAGRTLQPVDTFDARFDELWLRVRDRFGGAVERDARYLAWKFARQPFGAYRCLASVVDGALAGYAIVRGPRPTEPNRGVIADLVADPDDAETIRALIAGAIADLRGASVAEIEAATSHPAFERILTAADFVCAGESVPMLFGDAGVLAALPEAARRGWLMGRADSDWDQFPNR